jgi:hypothetical protein
MTSNYFSNFDDILFKTHKPREFNKLIDDECDIKQRNYSNNKKLKFVTTTFRDIFDAKKSGNHFGIEMKDQLFVPKRLINKESSLKHGKSGNILTNQNVKHELNALPLPTLPSRFQLYHGNVDIEDSIRNLSETNKHSCNPRDTDYYKRSFYIFTECTEFPDPMKSVESELRCGRSSRFLNDKKGKNYKKPVDLKVVNPIYQCNKFPYNPSCFN